MQIVGSLENAPPLPITELAAAADAILDGFDDRCIQILRERIFALESPVTLEELGQQFGLTRERVRQVEVNILNKLNKRLTFPEFACIARASKSFAIESGLIFPKQRLDELTALVNASRVTAKCPLLLPLLLFVGGPYGLSQDWIVRKPVSDILDRARSVLPQPGAVQKVGDIDEQLRKLGVATKDIALLLRFLGWRVLGDSVLPWRGSLADKAFGILQVVGRPMTREEISSEIVEDHSIRTLGNYLFEEERFVRVNRTEFGLATWGTGEYKGIIQELSAEILRSGGEATLDHLKNSLLDRFAVSEKSIVSYLNSPLFAKTSQGGFRLRRDDEEISVQSRVELTRSCFFIEGHWAYRFQVDDELIRGSGRNVPFGFAQGIGISPGDSATYSSECGEFRIGWTGPQPSVRSVGKFIKARELQSGDWLYLSPWESEIRVFAIRSQELIGLSGTESLFKQTCPSEIAIDGNQRAAIAASIGLSSNETWTAIKRRLLMRKELGLCTLVPEDHYEDDGDGLSDLFEYIGSEGL
jgi:hypothetical protein